MKYHQLCESVHSIDEIYNILSNECKEFKLLSNNFKYVPRRMVGEGYVDGDFYTQNTLLKLKTKPVRSSVRARANNSYELFNDVIVDRGHASRIHHMFATSTKGQNTMYPIDENAVWCFPIGEFKYSYIPNDFNGHFNLNVFSQMIVNIDELNEKTNLEIMVDEYEQRINQELDGDEEEISHYYTLEIEPMKYQLKKIDDIKSTDYINAFNMENEIWFNTKNYYVLSSETMGNLYSYIRENS